MRETANARQVGGSHYKRDGERPEHWDIVEDHGIGYLEGCATKYLSRAHLKGAQLQDLAKAEHYVEKLIETSKRGRKPRGRVPTSICERFGEGLGNREATAILLLFSWGTTYHLETARDHIRTALQEAADRAAEGTLAAPASGGLQGRLEGRAGTPEDGGHHARQQEEDDCA